MLQKRLLAVDTEKLLSFVLPTSWPKSGPKPSGQNQGMIEFVTQYFFSKPEDIIAASAATAPMTEVSERSVLVPMVAV